jgi:predicted RNase H-like nuclease
VNQPPPPNTPVRRTDLAGIPGPEQSVAPGAEYFVGADLAWGQRGTTGLAVLDDTGSLLDVTTRQTDEDILAWLRPWTAGPCFVAFDAPIIVVNPSGHRPCERLVSRHFGRYGASCHAANTANPSFTNGSRALRLADALALDLAPTGFPLVAWRHPLRR